MQADPRLVGELLSLVALMAGTIEYCEIVRRRRLARAEAALRAESARWGLLGLVRVFAVDDARDGSRGGSPPASA
jgi:hypothetical protein